ncbi:hypothetical protein KC207_01395 [Phycicoccus sp. BSK3Z-2]|uniref:Uncharacterized protein n=1 Tax=Phycicoccus avicenniae TaxID=2828860 RepID=A0A941D702_9MICO|nr:hypothetical protein [Phycicoccus avicenniae]MBR7741945.1 hypothetical protein [Phycicoccus avicenniae]
MSAVARLSVVLSTAVALVAGPAVVPGAASEPGDPLVALLVVNADSATPGVVDGPFDVVAELTGAGAADVSLVLRLPSWQHSTPPSPAPVVVRGGTCTATCRVTWRVDPADRRFPWYPGGARLDLSATSSGRSLDTYGTYVRYDPPVAPSWVKRLEAFPTKNTAGYAAEVFDTGGVVHVAGMPGRGAGERLAVTLEPLVPGPDDPPPASATGSWGSDPDTGYAEGSVVLDTTTVPEGRYRLRVQAHDGAGHWSYPGTGVLVVAHRPVVSARAGGSGVVALGMPTGLTATVQAPRASTDDLGVLRVTVGGRTTEHPGGLLSWYTPRDRTQPSSRTVTLPTTGLPAGRTPVSVEVLDARGVVVGRATTSVDVVDFQVRVEAPPLVVGRRTTARLSARIPAGVDVRDCRLVLREANLTSEGPDLCPETSVTVLDATRPIVPTAAGTASLGASILLHDAAGPVTERPVTVHARRTVTLQAPNRSRWGSVHTATVTVSDERTLGTTSAARSGLAVAVERRAAGSDRWVTVARGETGSGGVARLRYSQRATGRLRAVVVGTVPGTSVRSPSRPTTSVASVRWTGLPSSSRVGAAVRATVVATPYESGARVRFQARKVGARTWRTLASGAVTSSGSASVRARFASRGTWEVRVERVATPRQVAGYSSVRRVVVG